MHIHFEGETVAFVFNEEDIESGFETDVDSFITLFRLEPSPWIDLLLGIHEGMTHLKIANGALKMMPYTEEGHSIVMAFLHHLQTESGQTVICNAKQGVGISVEPEQLSEIVEACGIKIGYPPELLFDNDETDDIEDLDEFDDDETDDIEDLDELYDEENEELPGDNIKIPSISVNQIATDWVFQTETDEKDSIKSTAAEMMIKLGRHGFNAIPARKPKVNKSNPQEASIMHSKTDAEHKKTASFSYKFLDSDAAVAILGDAGHFIQRLPHEARYFKDKKGKSEIYITVTYSSPKEQQTLEYMLMEYAVPIKTARGEIIKM